PSALVPPRIAAGLYGRKSGEGWYGYQSQAVSPPQAMAVPPLPGNLSVWVDPQASGRDSLMALASKAGATLVGQAAVADVLLIQPWGC
ncbi:hypothetical protein ABTP56_18525, partial [Acinetobacter baumannii]